MKANEAPEEIYLLPDDRNPNGLSICWYEAPYRTGAIEYTRTNAFIEKARKWFIEHTNISQEIETNEDGEPLADSYIKYAKARLDAVNEVFENFKTYMRGEEV